MSLFHEYSLLIAIALPVVVILAINAVLFMTGERGTLLLPSLRKFPTVQLDPQVEQRGSEPAGEVSDAPQHWDELREAA